MAGRTLELIAKYKFIYLLASLLLLALVHPLFQRLMSTRVLMQVLFTLVFCMAIYAISRRRKELVIGLILLIPALASHWLGYFVQSVAVDLTGYGFAIVFFAFTVVLIGAEVLREERVTLDTISGAICVYLLIGLAWAEIYSLIEFLEPGSFSIKEFLPEMSGNWRTEHVPIFFYFSFVTLTTLGYGDITPLTPPAMAFAFVEAILGQIIVAVLIARLVGLHIVHSSNKDSA